MEKLVVEGKVVIGRTREKSPMWWTNQIKSSTVYCHCEAVQHGQKIKEWEAIINPITKQCFILTQYKGQRSRVFSGNPVLHSEIFNDFSSADTSFTLVTISKHLSNISRKSLKVFTGKTNDSLLTSSQQNEIFCLSLLQFSHKRSNWSIQNLIN